MFNSSHTPTAQHITNTLFKGHYSPFLFFNPSFFCIHQGYIKPSNRPQHSFTCSKYRNSVFWHIIYLCFLGNSLNKDSFSKHHIWIFSIIEISWNVCKLRTEIYFEYTVKVSPNTTLRHRGRVEVEFQSILNSALDSSGWKPQYYIKKKKVEKLRYHLYRGWKVPRAHLDGT